MAKTTSPLKIVAHPDLDGEVLASYVEKGHTVELWEAMRDFDLIVGPNCWRIPSADRMELPIKAARAARKLKNKEEGE
jgi:hypothetical protein